jgi:hypothetical protein
MDPIDIVKSPRHWLLVVAMNVLVLAELCVAMYLAAASPEDFTATFMKAFFGMLIPTLVMGVLAKRRLQSVAARTHQPVEERRLTL